jgi:hypothetical protein
MYFKVFNESLQSLQQINRIQYTVGEWIENDTPMFLYTENQKMNELSWDDYFNKRRRFFICEAENVLNITSHVMLNLIRNNVYDYSYQTDIKGFWENLELKDTDLEFNRQIGLMKDGFFSLSYKIKLVKEIKEEDFRVYLLDPDNMQFYNEERLNLNMSVLLNYPNTIQWDQKMKFQNLLMRFCKC